MKKLILIAGMPGSGKTTVAKVIGEHGFTVVSMGDVLREEAEARGLGKDISTMSRFMVELRKELGDDAVARLVDKRTIEAKGEVIVVDGVRSMREVEYFKSRGYRITLLGVLSPKDLRYSRLIRRKRSDDPKMLIELEERDKTELSVGLGEALALSDFYIVNDGSLEDLKKAIGNKLQKILEYLYG